MELETFFEQFELLADAPNGVQKLRKLILQLAVQGKLVPQDPNDEPAEVLLERIEAEKKRLVKDGKIKNEKELPPVDIDEIPFELPDGWLWARLGEICFFLGGYAFKSSSYVEKSNNQLIRLGNVKNDQILLEQNPAYIPDNIALINQNFLLYIGDVLITMTGTRNKRDYCFTAVIEPQYVNGANLYLNQRVGCFRVRQGIVNKLLNIFLKSSSILDLLFLSETGTANQGNIGANALNNLPFPLPPLAEQQRIVAKVDRLMSLCDELEARQEKRHDRILQLGEVATSQLLTPSTPEAFNQHWQGICDNFDLLYSTPANVSQLRQAILQLAVMGKLVPQDANDEPASALLERIEVEKARLVKEKKIKKSEKLPPVDVDEMPFELPDGWEWVRLGEFGCFLGGGTPSKSNSSFWEGTIPWVSPKDMKTPYIFDVKDHISEKALEESSVQLIPKQSLLIVVRGMILAHTFPVALSLREVTINQDMKALQILVPAVAEYLLLTCRALQPMMLKKVARSTHGTCKIDSRDVENFLIPLPPLFEQKRIINKVEQMMILCDELEAKLTQSISDRRKLMETAVRQVLAA